jgi:hypothetical protein
MSAQEVTPADWPEDARTLRQLERYRILASVLGKIWASTDVETILRLTLQELGGALNASEGWIQLGTPSAQSNG